MQCRSVAPDLSMSAIEVEKATRGSAAWEIMLQPALPTPNAFALARRSTGGEPSAISSEGIAPSMQVR